MSNSIPEHKATVPFILSVLDESEEEIRALGIEPEQLAEIYNDYLERHTELDDVGAFISRTLMNAEGVHSVKFRVKDPKHLLKKIVRKRREYPRRETTVHNYMELLNDLVGVRVLHLYKEDWESIATYIQSKWELKRVPYAYVKNKESSIYLPGYERYGCKILGHPSGYQGVHFVIETKPDKQQYFVEIQLRTLFEEGWSEIDHTIRYPDHDNSELLGCMLQLLNTLTNKSDELVTHMRKFTQLIAHCKQESVLKDAAAELCAYVDDLPLQKEEKQQLYTCIARITAKK